MPADSELLRGTALRGGAGEEGEESLGEDVEASVTVGRGEKQIICVAGS